jgi:hypothetical protein
MTEGYRLPPDLQGDLTWYWTEAESALGVRSTTGSQVALLQARAMPEKERIDPGLALERWRLGGPEERKAMRAERWEREDQAARDVFQTLSVGKGSAGDCTRYKRAFATSSIDGVPIELSEITYEPDWSRISGAAAQVRQRSRRVWRNLHRMKGQPVGVRHEFILFRAFGPQVNVLQESKTIAKEREARELEPLYEFTPEISRRLDGSISRRRVLELALRKPSPSLQRVLREQARTVLCDASWAYSKAAEHETLGQRDRGRGRVLRLMAAA